MLAWALVLALVLALVPVLAALGVVVAGPVALKLAQERASPPRRALGTPPMLESPQTTTERRRRSIQKTWPLRGGEHNGGNGTCECIVLGTGLVVGLSET